MDIRDEIRISKDDLFPKSTSLCVSDQNKHLNKLRGARKAMVTGRGSKVTSRGFKGTGRGSSRKWITSDMVVTSKTGHHVFNQNPVSEFNPTIGHVIPVKDKAPNKLANVVMCDKVQDEVVQIVYTLSF
ncbi:hypothetical protein Tco_1407078 [Tanacetum coccineum]